MQTFSAMNSVVESLREHGGVRSVYGEPIVAGDRTLIPVARVAYGFGGGYGAGVGSPTDEGETDAEAPGEGGGVGGGISVTPVGVVAVGPEGTRLVRFGGRRRLLGAFAAGLLAGAALGRRSRGSTRASDATGDRRRPVTATAKRALGSGRRT